jgi:hypothetical protein
LFPETFPPFDARNNSRELQHMILLSERCTNHGPWLPELEKWSPIKAKPRGLIIQVYDSILNPLLGCRLMA